MAKNFIEEGKRVEFTAAEAVSSGDLVMLSDLAAVALSDAAVGDVCVAAPEGVWELGAKAQETISQGAKVYWNPTGNPYGGEAGSGCITTDPTGAKYIGIAWAGAAETAASVKVKLNA